MTAFSVNYFVLVKEHHTFEGSMDITDQSKVLNPSQIIRRLTFLIPSLTTRLIQKFMQNITSFIVACFINESSSRKT